MAEQVSPPEDEEFSRCQMKGIAIAEKYPSFGPVNSYSLRFIHVQLRTYLSYCPVIFCFSVGGVLRDNFEHCGTESMPASRASYDHELLIRVHVCVIIYSLEYL